MIQEDVFFVYAQKRNGEAILMRTNSIPFQKKQLKHLSRIMGKRRYSIREQQRFRRAFASAQSRQNLCCSLT